GAPQPPHSPSTTLFRSLTDKQWDIVKTILPPDPVREDGRGRPWTDQRTTLNGILWVLRTGAPWADLPKRYGSYQTVHRRFQRWRDRKSTRLNSSHVKIS